MKLSFTLCLFLCIHIVKAQKMVTVLSAADQKPLSNVLIYYKTNLIAETDKEGKATINLNNIDSLVLVKNDYEDRVLAKAQVGEVIYMVKNKLILLKEVIVTPMTAQKLLKNVSGFIKGPNYLIPRHLQVYNKFMANNDTLHYLNNRLTLTSGSSKFKINDQTKLVKNFEHVKIKENISNIYRWGNYRTDFWDSGLIIPLGIQHYDFSDFLNHQDLFTFKIEATESYYRLVFKQRKKNPLFNIEGYMIVDKVDFGIYEFETRLMDNKPRFVKHINLSNLKPNVFKIADETFKFKYTKEDEVYVLNYCSKHISFTSTKAPYQNILFTSTAQVERTIDFEDKNLKDFDIYNWTIK